MAYKLTLTADECRAVRMMADRYSGATYLADMLSDFASAEDGSVSMEVSEPVAWGLCEAREEDMEGGHRSWPCFAGELASKLDSFCDSVV